MILINSWRYQSLSRFMLRDAILNVLLYVPLGAVARASFSSSRSFFIRTAGPVLLGFIVSTMVEIAQIYFVFRSCNILDVITNTMGSALGAAIAWVYRSMMRTTSHRPSPAVIAGLSVWVASLLFPFSPALGRASLAHKLRVFADAPRFDAIDLVSSACLMFVGLRFMRVAGFRRWWALAAAAGIAGPGQFFIATRQPLPSHLAGVAAGCMLYLLVPRRYRQPATLWVIGTAIIVRGFAPFRFSSTPNPFDWIPFGGALGARSDWLIGMRILIEKTFLYGALVWCLRHRNIGLRPAVLMTTIALTVIEAAQIYLPGRTPEITDPLLPPLIGYVAVRMRQHTQM
jgi:VanZ family protein